MQFYFMIIDTDNYIIFLCEFHNAQSINDYLFQVLSDEQSMMRVLAGSFFFYCIWINHGLTTERLTKGHPGLVPEEDLEHGASGILFSMLFVDL